MFGRWTAGLTVAALGGVSACGSAETAAASDVSTDVQSDATSGTDASPGDADTAIDAAADMADVADGTPTVCQPYCGGIGTKSEAWFGGCTHTALTDPATGFPMWDLCGKCTAVCKLDGSKSEGWYSSCTDKLIQWDNCM